MLWFLILVKGVSDVKVGCITSELAKSDDVEIDIEKLIPSTSPKWLQYGQRSFRRISSIIKKIVKFFRPLSNFPFLLDDFRRTKSHVEDDPVPFEELSEDNGFSVSIIVIKYSVCVLINWVWPRWPTEWWSVFVYYVVFWWCVMETFFRRFECGAWVVIKRWCCLLLKKKKMVWNKKYSTTNYIRPTKLIKEAILCKRIIGLF